MKVTFDSAGGESEIGEVEIECRLGKIIVTDHDYQGLDIILKPTNPDGTSNLRRVKFSDGGSEVYLWVRGEDDFKNATRLAIYLLDPYLKYDLHSDMDGAI